VGPVGTILVVTVTVVVMSDVVVTVVVMYNVVVTVVVMSNVVVTVVGDVVITVVVWPDAVAARAVPLAESISATAGGVTAAKRPAFSKNKRRPPSFTGFLFSSFDMTRKQNRLQRRAA
jgi:hypothetical protein